MKRLFPESQAQSHSELERRVTDMESVIAEQGVRERRLSQSVARFQELYDEAPVGYHELNAEGRITSVNRTELHMLGYTSEEMLGHYVWEFTDNQEAARQSVAAKLAGSLALGPVERTLRRKGGTQFPALIEDRLLRDARGNIIGIRSTLQDISERRATEKALRESEERHRTLIKSLPQRVFFKDCRSAFISVNGSFAGDLGMRPEDLIGKTDHDLFPKESADKYRADDLRVIETRQSETLEEVNVVEGHERIVEVVKAPVIGDDGDVLGVLGLFTDITDRKQAEQQLYYSAFHDALTGLPNRVLFIEYLERVIARTKLCKGRQFAVLFLDLDRFKIINDSLGHTIGDQLLIAVARRLETSLRLEDRVARIGGDEFTILLADIEHSGEATIIADRIARDLSHPFDLGGHQVVTTASIGIAPSVIGYTDPSSILRDADMAMYHAKSMGKSRYEIFDKAMRVRAVNLLQLESDLRRAVEREEFLLHYQPIVEIATGAICGFEALVRWQHPERGMVGPGEFIRVAEETRLIIPIGEWVLREACLQIVRWQKQFRASEPLWMSVNLSTTQFTQPNLAELVGNILCQTNLDPRGLKLEITESLVMENLETAIDMLKRLRALGIELSIDDFGSGYSSLSHLHRFPLSTLKIDQSFVSNMDESNENTEIVRTIVTLARSLEMHVVAEGVETEEQLTQLRTLGCKYGQGYLFSRPMNAEATSELLNKHHAQAAKVALCGEIDLRILIPAEGTADLSSTNHTPTLGVTAARKSCATKGTIR